MKVNKFVMAVVVGMSAAAFAADTDVAAELAAMKAQLAAQQARIAAQDAQISQLKGESWMTQRRAEEVKALIHEVLSDAETRASLLDSGMVAGYRDGFFLASEDGNFRLDIKGQLQLRYTYNHSDQPRSAVLAAQVGEVQEGFDVARAKIGFYGHMFDPSLTYGISGNFDTYGGPAVAVGAATPNNGDFELENAFVAFAFADGWQVKFGQFKAPFLREEAVDSSMQLAVERSVMADAFTVDYTQGLQISYAGEMQGVPFRAAAMWHDGSYQANLREQNTLATDLYDFAVAMRGEVLLAGTWDQFSDFTTWSTDQMGLMIGAAWDYEDGGSRAGGTVPNVNKWTADVSFEMPEMYGLNAYFAYVGMDTCQNDVGAANTPAGVSPWGFVFQTGVYAIPDELELFGRYEYIDQDPTGVGAAGADQIFSALTIGGNYYFHKHGAKATVDMMYVFSDTNVVVNTIANASPLRQAVNPTQALTNSTDSQIAVRAQVQLLF